MNVVMTEEGVDSPAKFCDPDVIALFPVRFALTGAKLSAIAQGNQSISIPENQGNLTDHEMRRIRAGYVYVFGDNDTWRVYRYLANPHSDENSTFDFDDAERDASSIYQFYEIDWSNGADSIWKKKSAPSPFVTLSSTVTTAWIAYSEERWPSHMLEILQDNPGLRNEAMVEIDLSKETTPNSFKLDQLSNKVTEFGSTISQNPSENQMRYTQLQPESAGFTSHLCDRNKETARVVALRDDLGEIADLGILHVQISQAVQQFGKEHYYATSMADCVDIIKDNVDESFGVIQSLISNHPLNPEYTTLRSQIETDVAAQRARPEAIVKLMADVFARSGKFSAKTEIKIATNGISAINTLKQAEAWEYAWFLIGRSWQFAAVTPVGTAIMGAVIAGRASGKLADWNKAVTTLLDASVKGSYTHSFNTLRHFNFAISTQAHAFAAEWTARPSGLVTMQRILRPVGGRMVNRNVPVDQIADTIRTQFTRSGFTGTAATIDDVSGQITSPQTSLLNVPMVEGAIEADVTSSGQAHFQRLHNAENVLKGVGFLAGLVSTYSALGQLSTMREVNTRITSVTRVGARANNAITQVVSELIGLSGSIVDVAKMRAAANLGAMQSTAMSSLLQSGTRLTAGNARVLTVTASGNGVAGNFSRFVTLGNFALAVGAAIAICKSYEGFVRGDMAATIGHGLIAAGSIIVIATSGTGIGAVIGLIMIAAGTVITIFADDDLESWMRGSFWGEGYYVYWDEERETSFSAQLEVSKSIADPNSTISANYKQELNAFLDLIWGIKIENSTNGDRKLEVSCSALKTAADISKLKVELTTLTVASYAGAVTSQSFPVARVTHQARFIGPGLAEVEFFNYEPPQLYTLFSSSAKIITATATFPKYQGGEWTGTLSMNGDDL